MILAMASPTANVNLTPPPTVGVIGCGPAGMLFLRQVENERERLLDLRVKLEPGNKEYWTVERRLASLPHVTVFEKQSRCGGLWQSKLARNGHASEETADDKAHSSASPEGIYDGMWINAPKELFEFEDYTFDEHFHGPMPAFITRRQVLGYLEGATGRAIDKFSGGDYDHGSILFDTKVSWVDYNETTDMFSIQAVPAGTTPNACSDDGSIKYDLKDVEEYSFDKVIFATGTEGSPNIPESEMTLLRGDEQKFTFSKPVLHSSQISSLGTNIEGKNFLFIGSAYSAEDLALSFIKRGAKHIYVTSRSDDGYPISYTKSWPMGKLTEMIRTEIKEVLENDRLRMGRMDLPSPAVEEIARKYYNQAHNDFVLEDIDAVIFCTGYDINVNILANKLLFYTEQKGGDGNANLQPDTEDDFWPNIYDPDVFDPSMGLVLPSERLQNSCGEPIHANNGMLRADPSHEIFSISGTHNSHLISNTGFFYHLSEFEAPILDLDIHSAYILKVILGDIRSPGSKEEMHRLRSLEVAEGFRHSAPIRYAVDEVFADAFLLAGYEKEASTGNMWFRDTSDGNAYHLAYSFYKLFMKAKIAGHSAGSFIVAGDSTAAGKDTAAYCGDLSAIVFADETSSSSTNTTDVWKFSERGIAYLEQLLDVINSHTDIQIGTNETFRDRYYESFRSIYTGTRASRFSRPWMELDDLEGDSGDAANADVRCYDAGLRMCML